MSDERQKPVWPCIVILLIGLPVLYVGSWGPACWVSSRGNCGAATVSVVYRPLAWRMARSERFDEAVSWYSELGAADGWGWFGERWERLDPLARWLYSPRARA